MLIGQDTKTITGAKIIIETLKGLGVDTIFGYPGGIVLGIYDELYNDSSIKHVLVRHEQSAVHAAEGYARITGKCGVVLVTSGPGATNTVTGIVNAYLDGYPLVVLTGQVFKDLIGKDAFQEADICDMTKTCTKKVFQITDAKDIQTSLVEAFNIAQSGKKGPVLIDMAKDIFSQTIENVDSEIQKLSFPICEAKEQDVLRVLDKISKSSNPVIVSGGGVTHANAGLELQKFSTKFDIPVVSTMMGLGTFPQNSKNYFGMVGIFGDKAANQILKDADLIVSLGARFNDRITCMFKDSNLSSKFVQIDINEREIGRVISPIESVCADIKDVLDKMNSFGLNKTFSTWLNDAQCLRSLNVERKRFTNRLHSFEVIRKIEEFTKNKDLIFTSEVGQHQLWAVQNLKQNANRKVLVSGGSGTMGFGFPAAIGAAIAKPENPVVCITGDGSFQMGLHELATCIDYDLDVKIMILNNGYLGMVRQLQDKTCGGRYSQTKISNPDFLKLAESYGAKALRVKSIEEVDDALSKAFSTKGTFIVDFEVEPMELL
ncbi:MAG: biosynthetic-type acetolactate synthase large subunit [Cyanobacteriota bacterium]|nr:biosynthetic-type acetolactate synthase large subunit [Cyanobacteriota bacterium]